jgi:hypothetical protein
MKGIGSRAYFNVHLMKVTVKPHCPIHNLGVTRIYIKE